MPETPPPNTPTANPPDDVQLYRGRLVGEWLRDAMRQMEKRTGLKVTNAEVARLVNRSPSYIGTLVNDGYDKNDARVKLASLELIDLLAQKLGADAEDGRTRRNARLNEYRSSADRYASRERNSGSGERAHEIEYIVNLDDLNPEGFRDFDDLPREDRAAAIAAATESARNTFLTVAAALRANRRRSPGTITGPVEPDDE